MSEPYEASRDSLDPLADFDVDALLEGASRLRPDRLALRDSLSSFSFAEADRKSTELSSAFSEMGLCAGETLLLASGAPALTFVALVAGLRAGLNIALAPAWAEAEVAARMALRSGAAALVAVSGASELCPADVWLSAAAAAPSVRLLCSIGAELDGAHRLDLDALGGRSAAPIRSPATCLRITTFDREGAAVRHTQRTLVAAGLDLVARARIGIERAFLSTIPPTSFAGLVCGPLACLLAGASLTWTFPFDADDFMRRISDASPVHLAAPERMGPLIIEAGLFDRDAVSSLILLSRLKEFGEVATPTKLVAPNGVDGPRVVDVYAFGERAAVAEPRTAEGIPVSPAADPHYLDFDGRRIMALDWSNEDQGFPRIEGAAASCD